MATLATLVVKLVGDARELRDDLEKSSSGVKKWAANLDNNLKTVGKVALAGITAGVTALGAALGVVGTQSVNAASDFTESLSKVEVVFGSAADSVVAFSETSARALGLTQRDALAAAGTFGNLFKNIGLTSSKSADMSTELITLAADLASFNNLNPTEVLDKLRSGLLGETEPLKTLGVNLTAEQTALKAVEMGLAATTKEVSQAALTQARFALIMEQTTLAQGDFARTASGLANTIRRLKAVWGDMLQKIGMVLLPILNAALAKLEPILFGQIIPALETALAVFTTFTQSLLAGQNPVEAIRTLLYEFFPADTANGIANGLMNLVNGVKSLWETVQPYVTAAAAWLAQNVKLQDILLALGAAIATVVVPAIGTIIGAAAPIIGTFLLLVGVAAALRAAWENDFLGMRTLIDRLWTVLQPVFMGLVTWFKTNLPVALAALSAFWKNNLAPVFNDMSVWMRQHIPVAIKAVADFFKNTLLPAIQAVWGFIKEYMIPAWVAIADVIITIFGAALKWLADAWKTTLYPALSEMYAWLKEKLGPVFQWIGDNIAPIVSKAFEGLKKIIVSLTEAWAKLAATIKGTELPKDLTPGSPTPFEIGLRGILDATRALSRVELPGLATPQLTPALATAGGAATPAPALPAVNGGMGGGTVYISIDGAKDPRAVADEVIRALQDRGMMPGTLLR